MSRLRSLSSLSALSPLFLLSLLIALLIAVPIISVGLHLFASGTDATWQHLRQTVLPDYIANSLYLLFGVGVGVAWVGVGAAWLTARLDFPGRRFFDWALILPLAMPAYVMAYVYTDLLQFVGPVQTWLRETFLWEKADYWFPDIRSRGGAITMFICVLYPYVYLLARTAFLEKAGGVVEAARTLGLGPWRTFWQISLPLARPAIVAGVALALMETLADYGTVAYFGVNTFTTGIYRAWFALGDRTAAAQLAALLLGTVLTLLALEHLSRGKARYYPQGQRQHSVQRSRLAPLPGICASLLCLLPLTIGFLLPAALLIKMTISDGDAQFGSRFITLAENSFLLAGIAAVLAVGIAVLLAYAARLARGGITTWLNRIVGLGYAVPGSVIAVGTLIPITQLDHYLNALWQQYFAHNPGLLLTGGIVALVYAHQVRFLSVALQTVESSLARIKPSMDDAARSLGLNQVQTLWRVHLPLLRGGLFTAVLLVFVDVMKELPATLVMRPFNFDTLATQTFTLASDERLSEASTAALAIVVVGLIPLIILSRQIARGQGK